MKKLKNISKIWNNEEKIWKWKEIMLLLYGFLRRNQIDGLPRAAHKYIFGLLKELLTFPCLSSLLINFLIFILVVAELPPLLNCFYTVVVFVWACHPSMSHNELFASCCRYMFHTEIFNILSPRPILIRAMSFQPTLYTNDSTVYFNT